MTKVCQRRIAAAGIPLGSRGSQRDPGCRLDSGGHLFVLSGFSTGYMYGNRLIDRSRDGLSGGAITLCGK